MWPLELGDSYPKCNSEHFFSILYHNIRKDSTLHKGLGVCTTSVSVPDLDSQPWYFRIVSLGQSTPSQSPVSVHLGFNIVASPGKARLLFYFCPGSKTLYLDSWTEHVELLFSCVFIPTELYYEDHQARPMDWTPWNK